MKLYCIEETKFEADNGNTEMYDSIDTTIMGKRTYDYVMEHAEPFPYPDMSLPLLSKVQLNR